LVGYSDHSTSLTAAVAAIALGAVVIERHFVIDKNLPAPDAFFSADPREMSELVKAIREAHAMLGNGYKTPTPTEKLMRLDTRKGLIARKAIRKGQAISLQDVIIKRPGIGVLPRELEKVIGRTAQCDIEADEVITWDKI